MQQTRQIQGPALGLQLAEHNTEAVHIYIITVNEKNKDNQRGIDGTRQNRRVLGKLNEEGDVQESVRNYIENKCSDNSV